MMLCLDLERRSYAEAASAVAEFLRIPGKVAVVPTETVYGVISRVTAEGPYHLLCRM